VNPDRPGDTLRHGPRRGGTSQLREALRCAARFDDRILIEDVVAGREIDVAVLRGPMAVDGLRGVARIGFFLTDHGPVLNELNTMPRMTAESQVPRMFAASGLPYEQLVARLVDAATVPGLTSPGSERVKP
jgi:D-alanine-D-alanine ligase